MHLLPLALPVLFAGLTSATAVDKIPTPAQVGLGKISGFVSTPDSVGTDFLTSTTCFCIDSKNVTSTMNYWQIEYYNYNYNLTLFMADSFTGDRLQHLCRSWVREPARSRLWKHELCWNWQRSTQSTFGYNGQIRGAGPSSQGYKREDDSRAEARCERFCPAYLGMTGAKNALKPDASVLFVLNDVDNMCDGCN
ncbi:hypothetical protein N7G274_001194 [Stereocaulon virgatum]|uniref:Uncharacterized protein n=1 Tax=Stereocaulon virgatum TaxID=373712 RepID=A0ABR4API7_9LECA